MMLLPEAALPAANLRAKHNAKDRLNIAQDPETGKVVLFWNGRGVLKQASRLSGRYKPVRKKNAGVRVHVVEPTEEQALFRLESAETPSTSGNVITVNVVGYVNLYLAPGLSLIANPLYHTNNDLSFWLPTAPDGAQVFKYTEGGSFELSTFDAVAGTWSNPRLQIPIGVGFYFSNPSSETFQYTFFGEVLQGTLVNHLPAGASTEGSLVPQSGSINSVHNIPGEPGDEIRTYTNDQQGGGSYNISIFSASANAWVPDIGLGVAQGFWIRKENAQDWVRVFYATPLTRQ